MIDWDRQEVGIVMFSAVSVFLFMWGPYLLTHWVRPEGPSSGGKDEVGRKSPGRISQQQLHRPRLGRGSSYPILILENGDHEL